MPSWAKKISILFEQTKMFVYLTNLSFLNRKLKQITSTQKFFKEGDESATKIIKENMDSKLYFILLVACFCFSMVVGAPDRPKRLIDSLIGKVRSTLNLPSLPSQTLNGAVCSMWNWCFVPKNVRVGRISYLQRYVLSIHDPFQMSSNPAQHTLRILSILLNNKFYRY